MRTSKKSGLEFERLASRAKLLVADLVSAIELSPEPVKLPSESELYTALGGKDQFFVLRDGELKCTHEGKLLFNYEEGDFIGIEAMFPQSDVRVESEFAVALDAYDRSLFLAQLRSSDDLFGSWNELLSILVNWLVGVSSSAIVEPAIFAPEIRMYSAGEAIMEEGTEGLEVFTLTEGLANVMVDGVLVGEVLQDEIFGAISTITNKPRSSTIVAANDCMVVVMTREQFLNLVQSRPSTTVKLLEDVARAMHALNKKVVELSSK